MPQDAVDVPNALTSPADNTRLRQVCVGKVPVPVGDKSAFATLAAQEGWVEVLGGSLPGPAGSGRGATELREGFGEAIQSTLHEPSSSIADRIDSRCSNKVSTSIADRIDSRCSVESSGQVKAKILPRSAPPRPEAEDPVWASLCCMFIFFFSKRRSGDTANVAQCSPALRSVETADSESAEVSIAQGPGGAASDVPPHALVDARRLRLASLSIETRTVTFAGVRTNDPDRGDVPVSLILLLPDGRWQELSLPKLELRFATLEETHMWVAKLKQWVSNGTAQTI
jgi:hypothetical protein